MAVDGNGSMTTHHSHVDDDLDHSNVDKPNNSVPTEYQTHNLKIAQMNGVTGTDTAPNNVVANGNGHANGRIGNNGTFQNSNGLTKSDGNRATDDRSDSTETEPERNEGNGDGLKKEIKKQEELKSDLNPMAAEFIPASRSTARSFRPQNSSGGSVNNVVLRQTANPVNANGFTGRARNNNHGQGRRRINSRTNAAQREEVIRRTVYVSDIDQQVTEEQLAALVVSCGQVVDCRICGDPNSALRFAFIEFTDEVGAKNALSLSGTMLGYYPVRILPSKTAIAPVNPNFLPRSEDEREMCARTIYCTNIDKKVTTQEVKLFFESVCGDVQRLRLLGDYHHSTRIAFVEFVIAESAIAALNCSGVILGSLPIRVSPSKTPVRPRTPRSSIH